MVSLVTTYHELCISQEGGPGVITTTQLFQFWAKKLAHLKFIDYPSINNMTLQCMLNNSHCVESWNGNT